MRINPMDTDEMEVIIYRIVQSYIIIQHCHLSSWSSRIHLGKRSTDAHCRQPPLPIHCSMSRSSYTNRNNRGRDRACVAQKWNYKTTSASFHMFYVTIISDFCNMRNINRILFWAITYRLHLDFSICLFLSFVKNLSALQFCIKFWKTNGL